MAAKRSTKRSQKFRCRTLTIERVEKRELLTASPGTFAFYSGELNAGNLQDEVSLQINHSDFTMGNSGVALIGFELRPAPGSNLNPGLINVSPGSGLRQFPDIAGSTNSLTLVQLNFGEQSVGVNAQNNQFGAYELDVYLAGDLDGNYMVDRSEAETIRMLNGVTSRDANYIMAADIDRNGMINRLDALYAMGNIGLSTQLRTVQETGLDEPLLDPGALSLVGISDRTFVGRSQPLQFELAGASFFQDVREVHVTVNGNPVPTNRLAISPNVIVASNVLVDGRNEISFSAVDVVGRPVYLNTTVWAGTSTLRVNLVGANGQPFLAPATVLISLSDDQSVFAEATSANGFVEFANVPVRTVLIEASAPGNLAGNAGVIGNQGSVQVKLFGFNAPSPIDNNDFSQGTDGWQVDDAPIVIAPHMEGFPGQSPTPLALGPALATAGFFEQGSRSLQRSGKSADDLVAPLASPTAVFFAASIVDNDLTLSTTVEGEQSISRTFNTEVGTSAVRIRYRFITSEVPGGYFGSQYNDYFRVSLRSKTGGGYSGESNSMNGLGLAAFNFSSGATDWREVLLSVSPNGDTIQADVSVANVGDGLYDSQVVIDFVEEVKDQVRPTLAWNNTQGGLDLRYTVQNGALAQDATIEVYFANGTGYANRLGGVLFTQTVSAGTSQGPHGPIHIDGNLLTNAPAGTTHLVAVASKTSVGALLDVRVGYGANANAAIVNSALVNALKGALRAAGQANATITSTARTAADQARAMFQNLTNPNRTIQQNIATQLGIYAPAGDAVINTFANAVQGLTLQQILANQTAIRAAMEAEINNQGPSNVSRHCANPPGNVIDVAAGSFNATNGALFRTAITSLVTRLIDERNTNGCYHLEL